MLATLLPALKELALPPKAAVVGWQRDRHRPRPFRHAGHQGPQPRHSVGQSQPDVLGAAYVEGQIDLHGPDEVIRIGDVISRAMSGRRFLDTGTRMTRRQTPSPSPTTMTLSNDFYQLWLDRDMVYSCAYFETGEEAIDRAQQAKLRLICRKLRLKPGDRLLDVGCGWGGLAPPPASSAPGVWHHPQPRAAGAGPRARGGRGAAGSAGADGLPRPQDERFDKVVSVGMPSSSATPICRCTPAAVRRGASRLGTEPRHHLAPSRWPAGRPWRR